MGIYTDMLSENGLSEYWVSADAPVPPRRPARTAARGTGDSPPVPAGFNL